MNPFFSIITPVFNRGASVKASIESVLLQTNQNFEMMLINDGSTDDTLNCIQPLIASSGSHLTLISYSMNKGVNYARNRGMERAQGQYLLFLDSDDHLTEPGSLETVRTMIEANPGYSHYLFRVSDRDQDATLPSTKKEFRYEDWIKGDAVGDFVHVITPDCFSDMPFLEDFRIYEALNWLRVLRRNGRQLYLPHTVTTRERHRSDSVTKETQLNNEIAQRNKFAYLERYLQWYAADYRALGMADRLQSNVKIAVLLGIALGEKKRTAKIIDGFVEGKSTQLLLKGLNNSLIKGPLAFAIRMRSNRNSKKLDR